MDIEEYNNDNNWVAQRKYDGVRCWATCGNGEIILEGRSGKVYTDKFPEIVESLECFRNKPTIVLDSEICCETFQQVQSRVLTKDKTKIAELVKSSPSKIYVFDIVPINYKNKSYRDRHFDLVMKLSEGEVGDLKNVELVDYTYELENMWEQAEKENWEGIILKEFDSEYEYNKRSWSWLKVKRTKTKDLEFDSYTINNNGLRATSREGIVIQVGGNEKSEQFLKQHKEKGFAVVEVEYLEEFANGKLRMPVCKEVKNEDETRTS